MKNLILIALGIVINISAPTMAANLQWNNVGSGSNYSYQPTINNPTTYTQIGNQMIGSDGSRATQIGNQTIYHDGHGNRSVCTKIGQQIVCR